MENKNSKLKGFTLIELIIVLAIFSGLMVLIMSFIDPVSRQMTDTSIRERTAAYADNISDYVDGSLRHAKFVKVYEKGYCDSDLSTPIESKDFSYLKNESSYNYDPAAGRDERWLAVRDFVDDYFDGAIKETVATGGATSIVPIKGKVHVLELLNDDTMLYDPTTLAKTIDGKAGEIYETVYDFTAGDSIIDNTAPGSVKPRTFKETNCRNSEVSLTKGPISVINTEHYQNYSYYYKLGMYSLEPVSDSALQVAVASNQYIPVGGTAPLPIDPNADYYYSEFQPLPITSTGFDPDAVSANHFALNVVAYQKNDTSSNLFNVEQDDPVSGGKKTVPVFRSPASMNSTSMALLNVIEASKLETSYKKSHTYYRVKQQNKEASSAVPAGEYLDKDDKKVTDIKDAEIEKIQLAKGIYDFAFAHKVSQATAHANSNNIYIIYAVPSEIEDADIT